MKFQVDLDPWVLTSNFKLKYFINEWMPGLDILTGTSYRCDLLMVSTRRLGNYPFSRKNLWVMGPGPMGLDLRVISDLKMSNN